MKNFIQSLIIYCIYRILYFTWRIEFKESPDFIEAQKSKTPHVLSMWHGNELAILHISWRYKLAALVSQSKDGSLMDQVIRWMGVKTARGSSSRGAVSGFKALVKITRKGYGAIFAVDGPKGPYREIKPGVFEMARLTRGPVFPSGVAVSSYWMSKKSWNKAILPKPFAKIVIVWGEAFEFNPKETDPRSPDLSKDLAHMMHNAEQEALRLLAQK
jgi:lysophospholipid acyltransferase (LPLAT)-like uncharacterized protein